MITNARKKTINGREVEYFDVIYHTTVTKFRFWDRVKILLGKEVTIDSKIYTAHERCDVVGSEAKPNVAPFFVNKRQGGLLEEVVSIDNKDVV